MKKYLLILITAFSFGQASNQMVSFSQAQNLGFALNSGQSHVNSSQCMTKSEALAKYNLSASAMSAYANNQLVPRSAWVNGVPYFTYTMRLGSGGSATCSDNNGQTVTMYSNQSSIAMPMTFYADTSLTNAFLGRGLSHYHPASNQLLTISSAGALVAISSCQGDTTPPTLPTGVHAFYDTGANFFVSWQPSTDNVGVVGYEVIDNTGFFQYTTQTSVYINNACGGNHAYQVRAVDAEGNFSAWSSASNVVNSNNPLTCQ